MIPVKGLEVTMNLVRWDPYRELSSFANQFNRALGTVPSRERDEELSLGAWIPPVDIAEEKDRIVLTAELPGFREDQVNIQLEGGVLTIRGERKEGPQLPSRRALLRPVRSLVHAAEQRGPREHPCVVRPRTSPRRDAEDRGGSAPPDKDQRRDELQSG